MFVRYARIGNYIDLGALRHIDKETFLSQFDSAFLSENELAVFRSFLLKCQNGKSFLLLADNCGEIVLDKLFLEQLKKSYPQRDSSLYMFDQYFIFASALCIKVQSVTSVTPSLL